MNPDCERDRGVGMDVDVDVVAGGGPLGLTLACELRLGGARVVVLERRTEVDATIKAGSTHPPPNSSTGAGCCRRWPQCSSVRSNGSSVQPQSAGRTAPAHGVQVGRSLATNLRPPGRGAGPGRPPGSKNKHRAPHYDVGKTIKRPENLKAIGKTGRSW
ncbi:hypothetical protein GCM10010302_06050 [Streptomyces polychromogenes]|uniref:FAD-binding domain-containing protein n=1 Tax=Streptomyces polychromogenes TaxID=67342 RepID=A0ABP3ERS2_9ACTN